MIKTVKVKKKLRLDELIKYVWDSNDEIYKGESFITFKSKDGHIAEFEGSGLFQSEHWFDFEDTFTVEVEEEITEDTVFNTLVDVNNNDEVHIAWNDSISLYDKEQTKEIHALINGKLELIYTNETMAAVNAQSNADVEEARTYK